MSTAFDQIRARIRERIAHLEGHLRTLDEMEADTKSEPEDGQLRHLPERPGASGRRPSMKGGIRAAVNNGGPPWAHEIDEVLIAAGRPLAVNDIVEELRRRGRRFGPRTRPDVIVRNVLKRRAAAYGWRKVGERTWAKSGSPAEVAG